ISAAICFSVTTAAGVLALTVLAADFFAADLVAAAGFLAIEILRITVIHKRICTLMEKICKPIDAGLIHGP
ncbi:MAG TPA: hypothetical protein VKG91_11070, partial [Roseiarcus sp.]|nr:hypothetical protein [Roseiarcus sp.]